MDMKHTLEQTLIIKFVLASFFFIFSVCVFFCVETIPFPLSPHSVIWLYVNGSFQAVAAHTQQFREASMGLERGCRRRYIRRAHFKVLQNTIYSDFPVCKNYGWLATTTTKKNQVK